MTVRGAIRTHPSAHVDGWTKYPGASNASALIDRCDAFEMRVALAQTCPTSATPGKLEKGNDPFTVLRSNLADAEQRISEAAAQNADVLIFPEYFLQGIADEDRQVGIIHTVHI